MKNPILPFKRTRTISDSESTELPDTVSTVSAKSNFGEDNISFVSALLLCIAWCAISVLNNLISKSLLNNFPYPLTSTLFQLGLTAIFGYPLTVIWQVPRFSLRSVPTQYIFYVIIPLSFGKFMAACGTHISVSRLPVSYAHTIKASMPIFVVVLSNVLYREKYSIKIYLSLFVIFVGIALASITELSFNLIGLISAVVSTASYAFLNILTKRCLNFTHMHQFRLLLILARISTVIYFPIWIYNDGLTFLFTNIRLSSYDTTTTLLLLFVDGMLSFMQNVVAFTLIAQITPLTYAVCNVLKRISVIVLSIAFFGNPVTILNMAGTMLAVWGVLLYNMVKMKSSSKEKPPILPMKHHQSNGGTHITNVNNKPHSIESNNRLPHVLSGQVLNQMISGNDEPINLLHPASYTNNITTGSNHGSHHRRNKQTDGVDIV